MKLVDSPGGTLPLPEYGEINADEEEEEDGGIGEP